LRDRIRRFLILLATVAALCVVAFAGIPYLSLITRFFLFAGGVALLLWGMWRAYHAFLWKVGRRLAFSYLLLGVLPIPLLLLLLTVLTYLLSGFFLGHLYRDAVQSLQGELVAAAQTRLAGMTSEGGVTPPGQAAAGDLVFAYYRDGKKLAGDPRLPASWPAWLEPTGPVVEQGTHWEVAPHFVALTGGGRPTLAAAVSRAG
jgi:hypothetical protein